ncbi:hypothetical protein ACP4OV_021688 [Aristida adscensionis]
MVVLSKETGRCFLVTGDPDITFPVVSLSPNTVDVSKDPQDIVTKTRLMDARMKLLKTIDNSISDKEENLKKLLTKFNKRKRKFDKISEKLINPCSLQLDLSPVKQEGFDY